MEKKIKIFTIGSGLLIVGLGFLWWRKKSLQKKQQLHNSTTVPEKQEEKPKPEKEKKSYSDPEELLLDIFDDRFMLLDWKNEQDLFRLVISEFGEGCKDYSWYEYCPKSLDELWDKIEELGLKKKYESILAGIYSKG